MLQEAFGDNDISQSKTFLWYKASRTAECLLTMMSVLDDHQHAQPQENITKVCEVTLADCRQTIHDVCEILELSYGTIQCILADSLNMRCISVRFVPRLLSDDQKAHRVSVCRDVIWDHSMHFGGQFEHEMHFCEICAKTAQ